MIKKGEVVVPAKSAVTLLRCYKEDHRISMDLYADELYKQLSVNFSDRFVFKQFIPKTSGFIRFLPNFYQIKIRFARVIGYPIQILGQIHHIGHILDHGYSNLLYYIWRKKTVVTVHDLIPLLAWRGKIKGLRYPNYPLLNHISFFALRFANAIIADSESTKNDLVKEMGLDGAKITVIHCGIGEDFKPVCNEERAKIRADFGLREIGVSYVLITGGQSYKNHSNAVRAVAITQSKVKNPIQIIRMASTNDAELRKTLDEVSLVMPLISFSGLSQEAVVRLFQCVDCLLFPSWYEGFGLPPLEAMACGVPVVASNVASLPEVVGDAAILADPNNIDELSNGLYKLLEDEALRKKYILRGLDRATHFTWRETAEKTIQVYKKILESK